MGTGGLCAGCCWRRGHLTATGRFAFPGRGANLAHGHFYHEALFYHLRCNFWKLTGCLACIQNE